MMRLNTLFWKLFVALFLAMQFWLFCGMVYIRATQNPSAHVIAKVKAYMLLREAEHWSEQGLPLTLERIRAWNAEDLNVQLSLLDTHGNLLHGGAPTADGSQHPFSIEGTPYLIATSVPAEPNPTDHPPIQVPILSAAVISLLLSWGLAWYLATPLQQLRNASRAMARGNFSTRVTPAMGKRKDEIVDLAQDFDRMAAQLQSLVETRQRLFHDISHELRSPLTRMQAAIGLLRQNPARTDAMLERVEKEAARINSLVEEVLSLARLEAGLPLAGEALDVVALLGAVVEDAYFEAEHTGRILSYHSCDPFVRQVNSEIFCRAFDNIIRNALHYTPAGKAIAITASQREGLLTIQVEDEGPGVNPQDYESIFEAFRRCDQTAGAPQGFGLGLAIARRAIEFHRGTIHATASSKEGGLCITVCLPYA